MKPRNSVGNGTHLAGCLGSSIVASFSRKASWKREFAIVMRAQDLYNIDDWYLSGQEGSQMFQGCSIEVRQSSFEIDKLSLHSMLRSCKGLSEALEETFFI